MRQLKRSLTVLEPPDAEAGSPECPAVASPVRGPLPLVPPMPLLCSPMDPPLQPPPWKRAARPGKSPSPSSPQPSTPQPRQLQSPLPVTPVPQSPPRLPMPQTPQRLLTPRISWSDIMCCSQESMEDVSSPKTPKPRRMPSPPQRQAWRRRPPSYDGSSGKAEAEDQNDGRFAREFCGVSAIGRGQFSTVFRAQHRIDQCLYAVKKTKRISRATRQTELREVFALANVSMEAEGCPHIVRYYSSWMEDGQLHIQTELCECSLRERMLLRKKQEEQSFGAPEIVKVLQHVATGLKVLHACGFVHLDIKPDNILVSRNQREEGCYKIADLGFAAAAMGSGCDDISEGDCRYLAKEVLHGDLSDLPKADVFSLGLLSYELATNPRPLPPNGEEWHQLRAGQLERASGRLPEALLTLLQRMVHSLPAQRPPCDEITRHPSIAPDDGPLALEELLRQRTIEAEKNRQRADTYWQEVLNLKRQELLSPCSPAAIREEGVVAPLVMDPSLVGSAAHLSPCRRKAAALARVTPLMRGKTF